MPCRIPFGSSLSARLACLTLRRFRGRSHVLVVPIHPLLLSAFVLADSALPRGSAYRLPGGYVVPRASHRAVASSACPGRERLMEQPVSSGHNYLRETEIHATCRSHVLAVKVCVSAGRSLAPFGRLRTLTAALRREGFGLGQSRPIKTGVPHVAVFFLLRSCPAFERAAGP